MKSIFKYLALLWITLASHYCIAQSASLNGKVTDNGEPLPLANVLLKGTEMGTATDIDGVFELTGIQPGDYVILVTSLGYQPYQTKISLRDGVNKSINIQLESSAQSLDETVVTGTLKPVSRLESPVPVEVYSPTFLKKNPTASVFDALQNVNGVRPQINCNVCNTGDIHINGLEGPYTLVLIDGMPIVSGLGTVYGLTGIPNSLIEQIEIVKGPASSLYGSEAVGGLINIITKNAISAPEFFADGFATGWGEYNLDVGSKISIGDKTNLLLGLNYFNYDVPVDNNGDNFTDLTLQDRVSIFQKWNFERKDNRLFSLAGRFFYEDRWGGEMQWTPEYRGGDEIYGESIAVRYNYYDDNTPATTEADNIWIPSVFVQDEYSFAPKHSFLAGLRYDYDQRHGNILTPRAAYKWKISDNDIFRVNAGTGFRVVNLFTEDHAALTGSRDVVIAEELKPERSVNFNINYLKKIYSDNGTFIGLDASAFYTQFSNVILPDYETNPNQIIYDNLDGKSVSQGVSANLDIAFPSSFKIMVGATWQDVSSTENGVTQQQILTESITATWNLSYTFHALKLTADYTGNLYGPMRLPLLGDLDPRSEYSPTWSIQNIQFTYKGLNNIEVYGGIKNLLDWTPNRGNPFIIARANDPFDREVTFDSNGNAVATANNPYALTFDPSYVYGPNQGIRGFFGLRYTVF